MNTNDLEDFVISMLHKYPDYKNRIIVLYSKCSDRIVQSMIDNDVNFSKEDEIQKCYNDIKELCNA